MKKNTKTIASVILCVVCLTAALTILCACEKDEEYSFEGVHYAIDLDNDIAYVRYFYIPHNEDNDYSQQVFEIPAYVEYRGVEYPVVGLIAPRQPFMGSPYNIVRNGDIRVLIIPETVTSIDLSDFDSHSLHTLERIIVHPDNPTYCSIGGALYTEDCSQLVYYPFANTATTLTIPKNMTSLGELPIDQFHDIYVEAGNIAYKSVDGALYSFDGTKLLHYSKTRTDESFTVNREVWQITAAFDNMHLQQIKVALGNAMYGSIDGVLCSADGSVLLAYPMGRLASSFAVPLSVNYIAKNAFRLGTANLTSIYIPSSVFTIESGAIRTDVIIYTDANGIRDGWQVYGSLADNIKTGVSLEQYSALAEGEQQDQPDVM